MAAKGTAEANAAMSNKYALEILGLPAIFFTRVGEISREGVKTELADKTWQSTGQVNPIEVDADMYLHHEAERLALEAFHALFVTGAPGNKLPASLFHLGADGSTVKASWMLDGIMCTGRKLPELSAGDDGEAVKITWMFAADDCIPLG